MAVGVRLHTDLQQREQAVWTSKIRYQIKEFSIVCMGRFKPLGSLNSLFSYVPQLSGPNPVSLFTLSSGSCGRWLPLVLPQLLSNHHGGWITMAGGSPWQVDHHGGWRHLLDWALGARTHIWRPEIADGCDISCLLIWQYSFSFENACWLAVLFYSMPPSPSSWQLLFYSLFHELDSFRYLIEGDSCGTCPSVSGLFLLA